jgi:hypothetical protein
VEVGYNESARAAAEPWSFETGGENAAAIQERCLDAALSLTGKHPFIAGMFLWKWFPELPDDDVENFRIQTPEIKALIAKHWRLPRNASADTLRRAGEGNSDALPGHSFRAVPNPHGER